MTLASNPNVKLVKATRDAYLGNQVLADSNGMWLYDLALIINQDDNKTAMVSDGVTVADHGAMYSATFRFDEDCSVTAYMYIVAGDGINQLGKVILIEDEMPAFSGWLWETKNGIDTPQLW